MRDLFNKNDFVTQVMTEEQRQNPELLKNEDVYNSSPISVYYGSDKKDMVNVCVTCKKKARCKDHREAQIRQSELRKAAENKALTAGLTEEQIDKLKHNVFIVINCINKEET